MRLATFRAPSLPEAMRRLRAELGDEAIIVASREVAGGGVEVTATGEEAEEDLAGLLIPAEGGAVEAEVATALAFHGVPPAVREVLAADLGRGQPADAAAALT